jgi:hypothetical protein
MDAMDGWMDDILNSLSKVGSNGSKKLTHTPKRKMPCIKCHWKTCKLWGKALFGGASPCPPGRPPESECVGDFGLSKVPTACLRYLVLVIFC